MGRVAELPTRTEPKSSEEGAMTSVEGVAVPKRLMKSREALESEDISRASMTSVMACADDAVGVKVTERGQLVPGTMTGQTPVTVKSGVVVSAVT